MRCGSSTGERRLAAARGARWDAADDAATLYLRSRVDERFARCAPLRAGRGVAGGARVKFRLSTKLLLAVLAAVAIPFLGFAIFVDHQMAGRLSKDVVLYSLKGIAADLALRVDRDVEEYNSSIALLAVDPGCYLALDEAGRDEAGELELESPEDRRLMRKTQIDQFNYWILAKRGYDLFLLVDSEGSFVAASTVGRSGLGLAPEVNVALQTRSYAREVWFEAAKAGRPFRVDQHKSDLLPPRQPAVAGHPENFHIGFSAPVVWPRDPKRPEVSERFVGAVYALVNWSRMQDELESPVLKSYFQGLVGPEDFPSAYGWIWKSDADTIVAHARTELYGQRVSQAPIELPEMVAAARASDWGMYPEYTFKGQRKNAAFKHTASFDEGGFGWVVGVGIDNDDIFKQVRELRELLFKATLGILLIAVLWTMVIARRTTQPILALREHVQRVAAGDLEARVKVATGDEVGELGEALNRMTAELAQGRESLIKAQKEAAWREMARQVAHDIKNPLTPIQLSIDLCRRAKAENSPQFEHILEQTLQIVARQVTHLREISSDFHALTGARKENFEALDLAPLLGEVLDLDAAWAQSLRVEIRRSIEPARVRGDRLLLRRVLLNLVSNALEAMPDGGSLHVGLRPDDGHALLELTDTGLGVPPQVREHLFEPYFTTRTTGTGLGLAIAKRVVEDHGGTIELAPAADGPGTVARVRLPLAEAST
jgi:signal transduction histidine kinase